MADACPIDETHNARTTSWIASANSHAEFPLQNLPLGIFSPSAGRDGSAPRAGVAIGDEIVDLAALCSEGLLSGDAEQAARAATGTSLNALFALGARPRRALRRALFHLLSSDSGERERITPCLHASSACRMHLPAAIGDFTDFYAGINHARNVGQLFRPDNPLLPNYSTCQSLIMADLRRLQHRRSGSTALMGRPRLPTLPRRHWAYVAASTTR